MLMAVAVLIFAETLAIVLTCHQSSADCESKRFVGLRLSSKLAKIARQNE